MNAIPSFNLPLLLQGMAFLLPAYIFDYKECYFFFQFTFLTTRDDIPPFSLTFSIQWVIFLLSSNLFPYNEQYFCFQLTFLTTRNDIPSSSLPIWLQACYSFFQLPFWLQRIIFLLPAYIFDYIWMIFLLPAYIFDYIWMIFLLPAYLFDYKGWYSFFQLTLWTTRYIWPAFCWLRCLYVNVLVIVSEYVLLFISLCSLFYINNNNNNFPYYIRKHN